MTALEAPPVPSAGAERRVRVGLDSRLSIPEPWFLEPFWPLGDVQGPEAPLRAAVLEAKSLHSWLHPFIW